MAETKRKRLVNLELAEVSGVDSPANRAGGWIITKAESGAQEALVERLRTLADKNNLQVDDDAINTVALKVTNAKLRGLDYSSKELLDLLREAAAPEDEQTPTTKSDLLDHLAALKVRVGALEAGAASLRTTTQEPKADPEDAGREALLVRQADFVARELMAQGSSGDELVRRGSGTRQVPPLDKLLARLAERAPGDAGQGDDTAEAEVQAIAVLLKDARIAKGWRASDLADELGVSHRAVNQWEAGETLPHGLRVSALCSALGLGVEEYRRIHKAARKT